MFYVTIDGGDYTLTVGYPTLEQVVDFMATTDSPILSFVMGE